MNITVVVNSQGRYFYEPNIHQLATDSLLRKLSVSDFWFQNLNILTFYRGIFVFESVDDLNFFQGFGARLNLKE